MTRPFEGLAAECDLVALREFVPSATATLKLAPGVAAQREVTLATVLPGAVAALVRAGDEPVGFVGTQMAWSLRPFIGNPNEEFAIFREGREGNFYSAVARSAIDLVREK